jgi:hypothetical protein
MEKQLFKKQVLEWIKENGIDIGNKRVKVFDSKRYGLEVRIYSEPIEFTNARRSHRKMKEPTEEYNSTYGFHKQKISSYTHINMKDFANQEVREFLLDCIRHQ